jgi:hypothetical protein
MSTKSQVRAGRCFCGAVEITVSGFPAGMGGTGQLIAE